MTTLMDEAVDVGTTKRLTLSVDTLDAIPAPLDASSLTLRLKDPDGIVSTPSIVHAGTGEYFAEFVVTKPGQWRYRWETTSPIRAREGSFIVRRSEFDNYAPLFPPDPMTWTEFGSMAWQTWNELPWSEWTGES